MSRAPASNRLLLSTLALMLTVGVARAETPLSVTDLLPDGTDRQAARGALSVQAGQPVVLADPDPLLLQLQRWETAPALEASCADTLNQVMHQTRWNESIKTPTGSDDLFAALLAQAQQQMSDLEYPSVLSTIKTARDILPCTTSVLSHDQVRTLFMTEALTHSYLKDGQHKRGFMAMLAIDSRPLGPEYNPTVRTQFREAYEQTEKIAAIPVEAGTPDLELLLDGVPVGTFKEILPGQHVIQAVGPTREARTRVVIVQPLERGRKGLLQLSTLADFRLEPVSQARASLAQAIGRQQLSPAQDRGMKRYLELKSQSILIFAVSGVEGKGLRQYQAGTGLAAFTPGQRPGPSTKGLVPPPPPSQRRIEAGVGFYAQFMLGRLDARESFQVNGTTAGPTVWVDIPVGSLVIDVRAAFLPLADRPRAADTTDCAHELDAQVECLPDTASFSAGLGLGLPIGLTDRLTLTPAAMLQVSYLPNTLLTPSGATSPAYAIDVPLLGLQPRIAIAYQLMPKSPRIKLGLEVSSGLLFMRANDYDLAAIPLAGAATIGGGF